MKVKYVYQQLVGNHHLKVKRPELLPNTPRKVFKPGDMIYTNTDLAKDYNLPGQPDRVRLIQTDVEVPTQHLCYQPLTHGEIYDRRKKANEAAEAIGEPAPFPMLPKARPVGAIPDDSVPPPPPGYKEEGKSKAPPTPPPSEPDPGTEDEDTGEELSKEEWMGYSVKELRGHAEAEEIDLTGCGNSKEAIVDRIISFSQPAGVGDEDEEEDEEE